MFRFSTRSDWDPIRRYIQDKKFYTTLPHKLTAAENEWHKTQPNLNPEPEFKETGVFGEEGWSISLTNPSVQTPQDNNG